MERWPQLDYPACSDAIDALHMLCQVVGKVKTTLTPRAAEWQNVPLFVSARGLTTGLIPGPEAGLEIAFDLVEHRLSIASTDGRREGFDLRPRPLRDFTADVMATLAKLDVHVRIHPMTVEVPNPVRCDESDGYDAYNPEDANRVFRILASTAAIFEDYRAGFWGKQTPTSFWWGSFDLAVTRYNLVPVPPVEGMDLISRVAMDSEQAAVGFWPGNARYPKPAFFAYTYPKPDGFEAYEIQPPAAGWNADLGEFILDYEDMRTATDPATAILEFANSTYAAGANLAGWDRDLTGFATS